MKNYPLAAVLVMLFIAACSHQKTTTNASTTSPGKNMKANLLDGTWEANYIMNTPRPFAELYNLAKPTITFNTVSGQVSGITGCNNFTGSFAADGNKISFKEGMAVTRKMCPDMAGEQLFLETLKKINTYSVTEQGKTLNLIMGDMAIMRLQRK